MSSLIGMETPVPHMVFRVLLLITITMFVGTIYGTVARFTVPDEQKKEQHDRLVAVIIVTLILAVLTGVSGVIARRSR